MARYVAASLLSAFLLIPAYGKGDSPKQPGPNSERGEQDFGPKLLYVCIKDGGLMLEKAKVRRLGDRLFLVGQLTALGENHKASEGQVVWTALSEVIYICEYDNLETYKRVCEEEKRNKEQRSTFNPDLKYSLPSKPGPEPAPPQ